MICAKRLVAEVLAKTQHRSVTALPDDLDLLQFTRQKFSGMVKGLFPKLEQADHPFHA
jgi:hypothetical protein